LNAPCTLSSTPHFRRQSLSFALNFAARTVFQASRDLIIFYRGIACQRCRDVLCSQLKSNSTRRLDPGTLFRATVIVLAPAVGVHAGEIGHYNGAVLNLRDLFVPPEPGFYSAVYNFYYTADQLNGAMIGELDYFTHDEHGVLDWFRDNEPVREKGYTTTLLGDDPVKYINKQDPNKPFYLYLTSNAPHTPYQAPKEYVAKYSSIADPTRRTYAGMVDCLDENIGTVVAALDKTGLRDNTLILFHSDNGGTTDKRFSGQMADVSKITLPCDNGPYRRAKARSSKAAAALPLSRTGPGASRPRRWTASFTPWTFTPRSPPWLAHPPPNANPSTA
jgi:hypothetical protein